MTKTLLYAGLSLFVCAFTRPASALRVVHEQVILDELADYDHCQDHDYSGDWCDNALKRWVKEHPADAFKAGKMTRHHMNAWGAIPFFTQAFEAKQADCKDEDVKLAVMSAIDLPADSYKPVVDQAKKIGFQNCFKEMKDELVKIPADGYAFKNVCKDLQAKGALSGLKAAKCKAQ